MPTLHNPKTTMKTRKASSARDKRPESSVWPYLFALFLAWVITILTWLTLSSAQVSLPERSLWSTGAFLGAASILFCYMACCLRRGERPGNHRVQC